MTGLSPSIDRLFQAYRTFDPPRWVSTYELLPMWGGLLAIALGLLLLIWGGGRLFRLVAGPLGALAAVLWAYPVLKQAGFSAPENTVTLIAAATLLVLGFILPSGAVFFAFGLPAGMLAGDMAGRSDWLLGFLPGFLVVGALATAFARQVGAIASAIVGAWLLVLGALAALHSFAGVSSTASTRPLGVLGAAAIFAVAGCAYQLVVKPSPEEEEQLSIKRAQLKKRKAEKRALEKRWSNYSGKKEK